MDAAPQPGPTPAPRRPPPPRRSKASKRPPPVFVPVELPPEESAFDRSLLVGIVLAVLTMVPLARVALHQIPQLQEAVDRIVEFELVEPPPPPEPEPEPEPTPPPPKPKQKVVDLEQVNKPLPTQTATSDSPPDEPAKPVFGVSMDSTVEGAGSFAVRVGNTVQKEPEKEFTPPSDVKAIAQVPYQRLETPPKLKRDFRAEYPPGAKEEGIEGTVILKMDIDETGRVIAVRLVRGVHPELDAASKAAAFKFLYTPGKVDGEPVVTLNFVHRYTWIIEG